VNGIVVVDASLAFKWLVREEHTDKALAILRSWESQGIVPTAPHLMPAEVTNALHRRVVRGEMSLTVAANLIKNLLSSSLELREALELHGRALELAHELQQGAVYDAHYLALSEALDCDLWTADEKFFRAASPMAENVRWIGEFVPPTSSGPQRWSGTP
jgi:pentatricopeptide repeat protein